MLTIDLMVAKISELEAELRAARERIAELEDEVELQCPPRCHRERDAAIARADAAEKRVAELEAERDEARRERERTYKAYDRAMEPLRKVCKCTDDESPVGCIERLIAERDEARAALARSEVQRGDLLALLNATTVSAAEKSRLDAEALESWKSALARSEAAAGQMRRALEHVVSREEHKRLLPCDIITEALESEAGRGWVSPEQHAAVVAERDDWKERAHLSEAGRKDAVTDAESAEVKLAAVTAQAAAMREALLRVGEYITRPDAPYRIVIDRALEGTAGLAYSEEMAALREVAEVSDSKEREHCEAAADAWMTDVKARKTLADLIARERAAAREQTLEEAAKVAVEATDDDWGCGEVESLIRALKAVKL